MADMYYHYVVMDHARLRMAAHTPLGADALLFLKEDSGWSHHICEAWLFENEYDAWVAAYDRYGMEHSQANFGVMMVNENLLNADRVKKGTYSDHDAST